MWKAYQRCPQQLKAAAIDKKLEKYIINMAALVMLPDQQRFHVGPIGRWSQESIGDLWMLGFLSNNRTLEADQPKPRQLVEAGLRWHAKQMWPQLSWERNWQREGWNPPPITEELFAAPTVSDAELNLLCRKVGRNLPIQRWEAVDFRQRTGVPFGRLYVPRVLSNLAGLEVQLGWEIIHDWLRPKDVNHGIDLQTIDFLLSKLKNHYLTNKSYKPSARELTEGCPIRHNGVWYQVVYSKLSKNWVLTTCYTRNAPGDRDFAIL
jgi:hypothetical protein